MSSGDEAERESQSEMSGSRSVRSHSSFRGDTALQLILYGLGIVLLMAALAKAFSVSAIVASGGLWSWRPLIFALIGLETALAVVLIRGPLPLAWWVGFVTFTVFALVSVYSVVAGHECNCFGGRIGAPVTLMIDVLAIFGLSWAVYGRRRCQRSSRGFVRSGAWNFCRRFIFQPNDASPNPITETHRTGRCLWAAGRCGRKRCRFRHEIECNYAPRG